ncbi:hypothetical protein [Dyadobacter sp. CY326]|uniref:hypothetical protein n=1 Tax=Dyadobacter sp. CY326 TaxID=2907300 RepID=UPI001F363D56|nr:hypothetical protein [Dyadobacter sp. CY326]MCE7063869.1 hypothetical protein [Dyadobacter sp. CY326]
MNLTTTIAGFGLLVNLFACQESSEPATTSHKSTLTLTFDGKTKTYTDASISEGKLGSIVSIGITAGSNETGYLSLTAFGNKAGTYPYKQDINEYKQVGQVEYKTGGTVFNNYFVKICPDKSGYFSTVGEIKITEYTPEKHAKGTFTGALLDANSQDECNPKSKSFSGAFDITVD